MTPSENGITAGQIGKIQENFGAALRKSGLQNEPTQQMLEHQCDSLVTELVGIVRNYVEAASNLIIRRVPVNRTRSPNDAITATGRKMYLDDDVVKTMPNGKGDDTETFFFNLGRFMSTDKLEKKYELHGLVPEDPYALAAINEADPAFADKYPNATLWEDEYDHWCYIAFDWWRGERGVCVNRGDNDWGGSWWFAGRRK